MKLALLKGNRFNPWHLCAFKQLRGSPEVVAFRAESEIQNYFEERSDAPLDFDIEPIYFDTQDGPILQRFKNTFLTRYCHREPRILPFHERLDDFDLIQTWELFTDWSTEALDAKRKWGIPLCVMVWDNIPFNMERNPRRRGLKERVAATADRFVVHTERSRRMLDVEGVDPRRIIKMDHGVDTKKFSPGQSDRASFGLEEDDFVILFVGWLLPRKGIDFLLLALRELVRDDSIKGKNVKLLVIGSGPGKARVAQLVERLEISDVYRFAGSLPYQQMPDAFRAADVFVLPSIATPEWQEQFGMSLIEAMACGIPTVSTYSGAISEIVEDAAVLCQPNDFVSLYEALKQLISSPTQRDELSQRARELAVARFTLDRYAAALSDVYDALLVG